MFVNFLCVCNAIKICIYIYKKKVNFGMTLLRVTILALFHESVKRGTNKEIQTNNNNSNFHTRYIKHAQSDVKFVRRVEK